MQRFCLTMPSLLWQVKITVKFSDSSNDQIPTLLVFLGDVDPVKNPGKLSEIQSYLNGLGDKILPESGKPVSSYIVPGFLNTGNSI